MSKVGWSTAILAIAGPWGCVSGPSVHPFLASYFDPTGSCFGPVTSLDVLDGPSPGRCNQRVCWIDLRGRSYVSLTMCDGPGDWKRVDQPEAGSVCEAALKAAEAGGKECDLDAGNQSDAAVGIDGADEVE